MNENQHLNLETFLLRSVPTGPAPHFENHYTRKSIVVHYFMQSMVREVLWSKTCGFTVTAKHTKNDVPFFFFLQRGAKALQHKLCYHHGVMWWATPSVTRSALLLRTIQLYFSTITRRTQRNCRPQNSFPHPPAYYYGFFSMQHLGEYSRPWIVAINK